MPPSSGSVPACSFGFNSNVLDESSAMIACHLRYIIDPFKLKEIEHYGKI